MPLDQPIYDCFYGFTSELPCDDDRLPRFQQQMIEDGWDSTQLWALDRTLFMFAKDNLEWIWKQSPENKPDDKRLFKSIKLNNTDALVASDKYELAHYFWQWLEINVLKNDSNIAEYKVLRGAFFTFLQPRLLQFTKNSKSTLVKDGSYINYFKMLDNTLNFVIPISLTGESENHRINKKRYIRMLNEFMKSIPGLWL